MWSNLTGTKAMTDYSPTIFKTAGLSGSSVSQFATGIYGIVRFIACVFFLTDSLDRRKGPLCTGIVQGLALYLVGFYILFDPPVEVSNLDPAGNTRCAHANSANGEATAKQWLSNLLPQRPRPAWLSLEDLNELFAQNDIRARFTPSRLTIIEADQD
ncbi:uncharacterized protein N7473_012013 [Penicillium subrubescens]|uniref:uncharacterized protein n=1 Tax=Penicillium subrubescens TaxID=1316194 RepID=UPI002544F190|nr:uncharacterized protein N7473_012013 [Penicillium subrubescens]KAJ5880960.1 hypothetical protein N7473_012013 [Penicillium subrubescens]